MNVCVYFPSNRDLNIRRDSVEIYEIEKEFDPVASVERVQAQLRSRSRLKCKFVMPASNETG